MTTELPLVSVVIPHQAGAEILIRCLETLTDDSSNPRLEILVVDNGGTDGSVDEAVRRFPDVGVVRLAENQGYAGGCNRGLEACHGDYVLFLNDDTELEPGCVKALVSAAERDPAIGACQPKIRSLEDRTSFEYSGATRPNSASLRYVAKASATIPFFSSPSAISRRYSALLTSSPLRL